MPLKQVIIAQVHVNGSNVNTSCDTSLTADTNKRELDLALIFSMQLAQIQVKPVHSREDCGIAQRQRFGQRKHMSQTIGAKQEPKSFKETEIMVNYDRI